MWTLTNRMFFTPTVPSPKTPSLNIAVFTSSAFESFGGLDIAFAGWSQGNIGFNEPGSRQNSTTRLILLESDSATEASKMFGSIENTPISSITMGVATILSAKKIYLQAWGEEKAQKVKECVEGPVIDTIPASYLQTHNNAHVTIDLSAAANLTYPTPWRSNFLRMERQAHPQRHRLAMPTHRKTHSEADQQGLQ